MAADRSWCVTHVSSCGATDSCHVLSGVTVNGKSVNIGNASSAAIDTGTTLIGAPTAAVTAIWSAVSGARALTGQMAGFWAFRKYFLFPFCDTGTHQGGSKFCIMDLISSALHTACPTSSKTTQFTISMSFGGPSWPINLNDMNLGNVGGGQCLGAIFDISEGTDINPQSAPAWIVGDTFLVRFFSSANLASQAP